MKGSSPVNVNQGEPGPLAVYFLGRPTTTIAITTRAETKNTQISKSFTVYTPCLRYTPQRP